MTINESAFREALIEQERSPFTIAKYLRDVRAFALFAGAAGATEISKELVRAWKESLSVRKYAVSSINSMLSSLNAYLRFIGREDCRVKSLKLQNRVYSSPDRELTEEDYKKLMDTAEGFAVRLYLILYTLAVTGIRISELQYFTAEAVKRGEVTVVCKGKIRVILLPEDLRKRLRNYCCVKGIRTGLIFRTRGNKPVDRSNIWAEMKRLCKKAGVEESRVFPHNFRKLFARCFYQLEKDLAKLADMLGHSSINTTRIYIKTSGREHQQLLDRLCLLRE